jgi:predicted nucleic-acid-binding Zn-ribbon protein
MNGEADKRATADTTPICPGCLSSDVKETAIGEVSTPGLRADDEALMGTEIECLQCGHIEFYPTDPGRSRKG